MVLNFDRNWCLPGSIAAKTLKVKLLPGVKLRLRLIRSKSGLEARLAEFTRSTLVASVCPKATVQTLDKGILSRFASLDEGLIYPEQRVCVV
jgi:hypothetical protein